MKKLKLDLAQIKVDSFAVATKNGGGTVNAHDPYNFTDVDCDVLFGTTTLKNTDCNSCPFCVDEPIGP